MLKVTWTNELPCPSCGIAIVWTMPDREYREVRAQLDRDAAAGVWAVDCVCGGCEASLLVVLSAGDGGLDMEVRNNSNLSAYQVRPKPEAR